MCSGYVPFVAVVLWLRCTHLSALLLVSAHRPRATSQFPVLRMVNDGNQPSTIITYLPCPLVPWSRERSLIIAYVFPSRFSASESIRCLSLVYDVSGGTAKAHFPLSYVPQAPPPSSPSWRRMMREKSGSALLFGAKPSYLCPPPNLTRRPDLPFRPWHALATYA